MNSFDLDIKAIRVPSDVRSDAGSGALAELAVMQEGIERNDERLMRSLSSFKEFWGYLKRRFSGSGAATAVVGSTPWTRAA